MIRLWQDFQAHKLATILLLVYWLTTLVVATITWNGGIPGQIVSLLLTTPLIAGALVGWWRASMPKCTTRFRDQISGGMLVGVLSAEIILLVMRGGIVSELTGWMHGDRFRAGEVLEFFIASGFIGVFLGLVGALFAIILERICHQGKPTL